MECPSCGEAVDESADYCSNCGTSLSKESMGDVAEKHFEYEVKSAFGGTLLFIALAPLLGLLWTWKLIPYQIAQQYTELLAIGYVGIGLAYLYGLLRLYRSSQSGD